MTGPRRGGLGRGLGALIPSAARSVDDTDSKLKADGVVMSTPPRRSGRGGAAKGSGAESAASGAPAKAGNRVPSVATIAASSATDFYFDPSPVPGASLREVRPEEIRTNPKQPRTVFDEEALEELAHSIREFGVLQPIVVRPTSEGFELVMGERRLRASIAAGLERIPAIVRETADSAMLRDALLENIHRAQLNPLEEAAAYQQLLEEFGVTHDELASRIGRSRSQVSNTIRLMNLSVPVQRRVAAGVLSAGHARALLALTDRGQQDEFAARIVAEGLSVRATEELVAVSIGRPTRKPAAKRGHKNADIDSRAMAARLAESLETSVHIQTGQRRGKIVIEFGSPDDLARIAALIDPRSR